METARQTARAPEQKRNKVMEEFMCCIQNIGDTVYLALKHAGTQVHWYNSGTRAMGVTNCLLTGWLSVQCVHIYASMC